MENNNFRFFEFGEFRLDARRRVLFKNGVQVPLTARNFDLLLVLIKNDGRLIEHEELLEKVWEGMFVEQSNLKKGISALRQILEELPNQSLYIKTIPRRGYAFIAQVRALPDVELVEPRPTVENILEKTVEEPAEEKVAIKEVKEVVEESGQFVFEERPVPSETKNVPFWRRLGLPVLALVTFLVIGVAAFGIWQFFGKAEANTNIRFENLQIQKLSAAGNVQDVAISSDGKIFVYATQGENNKQALWAKRIGSSSALQIVPPDNVEYDSIVISPDSSLVYYSAGAVREQNALYQIPIFGGAPRKLNENLASSIAFSPDGKRIAFLRDELNIGRTLIIANAENGTDEKRIYTVTDNHTLIKPEWSPDSKHISFISSEIIDKGRIWTMSEIPVDGGEVRHILAPQRGKIYYYDWINNGKGLIVSADPDDSRQTQVWYYSYPNGEKRRLTNDILVYQNVSVSADGNTILALQYEKSGDIWSLNWNAPQNATRLTQSGIFISSLAISPQGKLLTETGENNRRTLFFVDADGGNPAPAFSQSNTEMNPSFAPNGKSMLFTSRRSGAEEIWQADADGRNPKQLTNEKTFIDIPKFSPDGKYIFFGRYDGARWRLVKMPADGSSKFENLIEETFLSFDFSPDGKLMAYNFYDEQKKRWQVGIRDVATNTLQKQIDIAPITFVHWTPDGKSLIYNYSESSREGGDLWIQPLDGNPPKMIFDAGTDKIFWAEWSPDGQKLYMSRGRTISNIILLSQTKQN